LTTKKLFSQNKLIILS